jgi:hypothetical protein
MECAAYLTGTRPLYLLLVCDADEPIHFWAYFGSRKACPSRFVKNKDLPALILARHPFGGLAGLPPTIFKEADSVRQT